MGSTVASLLARNVRGNGDEVAVRRMHPDGSGLEEWTWADVGEKSARMAAAYGRLGLERGDRVLLFLRNRPEFHVADLGVVLAGGTPLSIYNSSSPEQVAQLAGHSRSRVAVVEDVGFLERLLKVRDGLPELRAVVVVDDPDGPAPAGVHRLADLLAEEPVDLAAAAAAVRPEDLVTVIYTSGTTGPPKGVMLTHANVDAACTAYAELVGLSPGRRSVSYLPMAHIAERMVTHYGWLWNRSEVTCFPDQTKLAAYLARVRPTNLFGPPRVFEKLRAGIQAAVAAAGPEQAAGFERALAVGRQVAELRATGAEPPPELAAAWQAVDAAVFAPIRTAMGLDQLDYCFSGAAPLPVWAAREGITGDLAAAPEVRAELERGVAEINARVSQAEGIKRFAVLADEWVPDSPQLTATMKLKRRGVHAAYADVIESLYAD